MASGEGNAIVTWRPAGQTLMTQQVDPTAQGRLQGALTAIQGIAFMIGPVLFTTVFAVVIEREPAFGGAPFLLGALLLAAGLAVAWRATRGARRVTRPSCP